LKTERGFTLIELLIGLAITATIMSALVGATFQVINVTTRGSASLASLQEVRNAAHWISRDGQSASSATGGSGLVLTLPDASTITYSLNGQELVRTVGGVQALVAQNISSASFTVDGRIVTAALTSSPRTGISEDGSFQVYLRPGQ
jgi:prepilin-type N-terminal cleavage/methylation domain-containing protein